MKEHETSYMDPIRGEGGCVRVSSDDAVDKVFLLQYFMCIISVPCNLKFISLSVS